MAYTNRQKALVALCAVGVLAFVGDRLFSSDSTTAPSKATASVSPNPDVPSAVAGPIATSPADSRVDSGKLLAQRLQAASGREVWKIEDLRDAFTPSGQLQCNGTQQPHTEVHGQPRAEVFARQHALEAVLVGGDVRQAIIDGKCVKIGQRVEEFELQAVGEKTALLVAPGGARVTFTLPDKPEAP